MGAASVQFQVIDSDSRTHTYLPFSKAQKIYIRAVGGHLLYVFLQVRCGGYVGTKNGYV